jgi:hypothetical protein
MQRALEARQMASRTFALAVGRVEVDRGWHFPAQGRSSRTHALDSVRVIGNEAVHPGQIDLRDTPEIAMSLFGLVNFIVEKMITEPKEIDAFYGALPATKLDQIAKRDGTT